ncbi:tail fiber assembly protein [Citromicrobium bathyomarinum]|uniref:tail fiber assembly protein n=1 Tax=Citromicrobium bathyomarinum TaxID=72174 RepID=UPI00315A0700
MGIFFDTNPDDGTVRFHHESVLGHRRIPAPRSEAEVAAGKRPKMIDNPACRIPADARPIDEEDFEALFAAQARGKQILMRKGKPVALDPVPDVEEARTMRRAKRDRLLGQSDWTQLPDSPLSDGLQKAWANYRQALRDLDMAGEEWPVPPGTELEDEEAE